jgi:hypothetical protein
MKTVMMKKDGAKREKRRKTKGKTKLTRNPRKNE